MNWSIRARLTAWYSLVVVAVLAAGAIAVAVVQERLAIDRLDRELQRLTLTLEAVMRTELNDGMDLRAAAAVASGEVVAPDRTLMLTGPGGGALATWGQHLPAIWHAPADSPVLETIDMGATRVRVLSRPVAHADYRYVVTVLAPLAHFDTEHAEIWRALAAGIFAALAVAAVGGWIIARQTLRPLTEMALQATSVSGRDPSTRLHARNDHDEVGQFAAAFNALLDRLAEALHGQRQFMADASHELRTPVSVVRTTAQVTLARTGRSEDDYRESLTIVAEQSARLARLVDAMFLLSRAEALGIPLVREPLYLDDVVAECARALRVLADERGVSVETWGDAEVMFSGDDTLLRQMVANLIDNAIAHARPGGAVVVTVRRNAADIAISVTDDGAGVPAAERDRIFQRFVRLGTRSSGAGLGLPIARWIAEAHGGTLVLTSSGDTGSCFTASLPA